MVCAEQLGFQLFLEHPQLIYASADRFVLEQLGPELVVLFARLGVRNSRRLGGTWIDGLFVRK